MLRYQSQSHRHRYDATPVSARPATGPNWSSATRAISSSVIRETRIIAAIHRIAERRSRADIEGDRSIFCRVSGRPKLSRRVARCDVTSIPEAWLRSGRAAETPPLPVRLDNDPGGLARQFDFDIQVRAQERDQLFQQQHEPN